MLTPDDIKSKRHSFWLGEFMTRNGMKKRTSETDENQTCSNTEYGLRQKGE